MEFTLDDLRSAYRQLDQRADQGADIPEIMADLGIRVEGVIYIAEQRGIRAALIATGEVQKMRTLTASLTPRPVALNREQKRIMAIASACEMEAIAATLQMVRSSG